MKRTTAAVVASTASICALVSGAASGKDVGKLGDAPARVDITETSLLNYHFDNRNGIRRIDDNYGEWINRFNVLGAWKSWQIGIRLDTALYANRPTLDEFEGSERSYAEGIIPYRYRDQILVQPNLSPGPNTSAGCLCDRPILPSKFFVTYIKPKFEVTLGDAYVAFGRGLVLNMRKIDELGADTTLQGAKVLGRLGPITLTAVAGLSNPTRVDDATASVLRDAAPTETRPYKQTWSRDTIVGARAEARVKTSTLGLHWATIQRRHDLFTDDPTFVRNVHGVGATMAIPKISDAFPLNVYTELAMQAREPFLAREDTPSKGYAAYTAMTLTTSGVTFSLEGKHYRHYNPVRLNADRGKYQAFQAVQYTANPTVELITQDSLFDNSCTTGGRARVDVKATKEYTVFGSAGRFANWGQACGAAPTLGLSTETATNDRHDISDFFAGFELRSQKESSWITLMLGTRRETRASDGEIYYREGWMQANASKVISGLWSIEVDLWHRNRNQNKEAWREGQSYVSIKYASKRSIILGHEYTTRPSQLAPGSPSWSGSFLDGARFLANESVQHFLNIGGQIKFDDSFMIRFMLGQQRGALKCVSGVCRFFPAFEGARTELIFRY